MAGLDIRHLMQLGGHYVRVIELAGMYVCSRGTRSMIILRLSEKHGAREKLMLGS